MSRWMIAGGELLVATTGLAAALPAALVRGSARLAAALVALGLGGLGLGGRRRGFGLCVRAAAQGQHQRQTEQERLVDGAADHVVVARARVEVVPVAPPLDAGPHRV